MNYEKMIEEENKKHKQILDALNMTLNMYEKDARNDRERAYRNAEASFKAGGNVDTINEYLDTRTAMGVDPNIEKIKKEIQEEKQRHKSVIEPLQAKLNEQEIAAEKVRQEQEKREEDERNKRKQQAIIQAEKERQEDIKRQEELQKEVEKHRLAREKMAKEQEHQNFLRIIREKGLKEAPLSITSNPEYVMEAVRANGMNLQFASPELQRDPAIVSAAVRSNGYALQFASPEMKKDRWVVLDAVEKNGEAIKYASPELQTDIEIAMEAVKNNGKALEFISPELQAQNPEIVVTAIKEGSSALVKPHDIFMLVDKDLRESNPEILEAYVSHPRTKKMLEYNLYNGERDEFINAQDRLQELTNTTSKKPNYDLFAQGFRFNESTQTTQPKTEPIIINEYREKDPSQVEHQTGLEQLSDDELVMQQALIEREIENRASIAKMQQQIQSNLHM